jgi:hypothetical protein
MPTLALTITLCAEQAERLRRLAQELDGSRRADHAASRRRLRVRQERIWLAEARPGELAVVQFEVDEPATLAARIAQSGQPFDRWFSEQWLAVTGYELARSARLGRLDPIFEWKAVERSAAGQDTEQPTWIDRKEIIK